MKFCWSAQQWHNLKYAVYDFCKSQVNNRERDNVRAFYKFYTFTTVEYQQNSDIVNDVIDYVLCCVLSNELCKLHMGKIPYEDTQTLRQIGCGYKTIVTKFPTKMS